MFFSAFHESVKLRQDATGFVCKDNTGSLIICDGIGEFPDSGIAARTIVDVYREMPFLRVKDIISHKTVVQKKKEGLIGGTTIILAVQQSIDYIRIEHLGNGGVIHLMGDFASGLDYDVPYRYSNIVSPHVQPNRSLYKHVSHHSGRKEHKPSSVELNLIAPSGDILLLFSDGISSLEDRIIIKDDEGRFWRHESSAIQFILSELDTFLKAVNIDSFQTQLEDFNQHVLSLLKEGGQLEDDASLGIIITDAVLSHYAEKRT